MKMSFLIIVLFCSIASVFGQNLPAGSIIGKWEFLRIQMDEGLSFDFEMPDSSRKNFFELQKKRPKYADWSRADSMQIVREFNEMKSILEQTFFVFNSDGSFVTNFFAHQGENDKGVYKYSKNEVLLYVGNHLINHNLKKIYALTNTTLTLICSQKNCMIFSVTFKKR